MPEYVVIPRALDKPAVESLRTQLLSSPYVAHSTLGGSFRGSRGFAITFTQEGRPSLEERFPFLRGYLAQALAPEAGQRLLPWHARFRGRMGVLPNAFYLNLLILADGGSVGRHVDATLRGPSGVVDAIPQHVSVLYLAVPRCEAGGELRLYRDQRRVGRIRPESGTLLLFRGDLVHEVTEIQDMPEGDLRISLVCEQYHLPLSARDRLPRLHVQSKAGFAAYLAERRPQSHHPSEN